MAEEAVPLLSRVSASLALPPRSRQRSMLRMVTSKTAISIYVLSLILPILFWHRGSIKHLTVTHYRPFLIPSSQFVAVGTSQCLPPITPDTVQESINKHAICRRFSPFATGRVRIATVTAHFGRISSHFQKALRTHLLHSLIHGNEVRVMCDPIVDDLWNKPAFILDLLMREMMKPAKQRLEWIMWVDRDTMILDQCRPMSSFLPPDKSRFASWWPLDHERAHDSPGNVRNATEVNLLVTTDWNGLNNGVFLIRVNNWAVSLFTAILAFRHYKPEVNLPFTEQSAMEQVIRTEHFRRQTRVVPQHWFNAYDHGGPGMFAKQNDTSGLDTNMVRRGDYLVHFAGHPEKERAIDEYVQMLRDLPDVWESGTVQRDVSANITDFWRKLGW